MKFHKWSRSRFKAEAADPVCTVCGLQAVSFRTRIGEGASFWVIDAGEVWGSHVPIRYPRARIFCSGRPEPTEAYRI